MRFSYNIKILFFLFLILLSIPLYPQEKKQITNFVVSHKDENSIKLSKYLKIVLDKKETLKFEDFIDNIDGIDFDKEHPNNFNYGYLNHPVWVFFKIKNDSEIKKKYIEYTVPTIDNVWVKIITSGKEFNYHTGDLLNFDSRPVLHKNFIFPLELEKGEIATIILKFKTEGSSRINLILHSDYSFDKKNYIEQIFIGVYMGVLIGIIILNLFIYYSIREKLYLYFISLTIFILLYLFSGIGYSFWLIWPDYPAINNFIFPFNLFIICILTLLFAYEFLEIGKNSIILKAFLFFKIGLIFLFLFLCLTFFLSYKTNNIISKIFSFTTILYSLILAIVSLKENRTQSIIFLVSFFGVLLAGLINFLTIIGFITNYFLEYYGGLFGVFIGVVLVSIGLTYRVNLIRKEKIQLLNILNKTNQQLNIFEKEFEIAENIQKSILPTFIPEIDKLIIQFTYLPSNKISGDYYDFIKISDEEVGIFLGDVTGSGISASLFSSMVKLSFSNASIYSRSPEKLLEEMNRSLYGKMNDSLLTASYLYINMKTRRASFSRSGNPSLLFLNHSKNEIEVFHPSGRIIGISEDLKPGIFTWDLGAGDRIFIYTNGVTSCKNANDDLFGEENLHNFLLRTNSQPLEYTSSLLKSELADFTGNERNFEDDITFIFIDIE